MDKAKGGARITLVVTHTESWGPKYSARKATKYTKNNS